MDFNIKLLSSMQQISAQHWDELCPTHYPFLKHAFLHALETSGCVSEKTGWVPMHLCVYEGDTLVALMPMYQKNNSNGEYVFDWDWADAYHQHQIPYYPKLLTAIPFSPCYGPRIISSVTLSSVLPVIVEYIKQLCQQQGFSGWHGLFNTSSNTQLLAQNGLLTREALQYHWHNKAYCSFEHYLEEFTSRKRKNIKRERRIVTDQSITMRTIEGSDIDEHSLEQFYYCYQLTYLKRGRKGYLNREFFQTLLDTLSEHIVCFVAIFDEKIVACAWCFKNTDPQESVLYGRYWGCLESFDHLHFETCYYQGLEYCIEHNIQRFDPGAQGEHKIQRGFEPITTYSSHYIEHPEFKLAIEDFLARERIAIAGYQQQLTTRLPFKKNN